MASKNPRTGQGLEGVVGGRYWGRLFRYQNVSEERDVIAYKCSYAPHMQNPYLRRRLEGIQQQLNGAYVASGGLATATTGAEREFFIDLFLAQVLPPAFRFGSGDVTDLQGLKSGQLDVVVEYPLLPSLPLAGGSRHRLYIAEGVAFAIEVKSNLEAQWGQGVIPTAQKLKTLRRTYKNTSQSFSGGTVTRGGNSGVITGVALNGGSGIVIGGGSGIEPISVDSRLLPISTIPIFAVGYTGWRNLETLTARVRSSEVNAALILDSGHFATGETFGNKSATGAEGFWEFISCMNRAVQELSKAEFDLSLYFRQ